VDIDMTEQDNELLSQYIDGELAADTAQTMRKRLLAEPELRAHFERMKDINSSVRDAFDVPGADTVPASALKALESAETRPSALPRGNRTGWGLAVAASLVAATGLLLTPDWNQQPGNTPTTDTQLAAALEQTASRGEGWDTLADGRQIRSLLSFPNTRGGWCREYLMSGEDGNWRGVACRNEGQWTTEVLNAEIIPGAANEYRPAGTSNTDDINAFIATHSSGIALSLQAEADLIARKWQ
jgi:hypothetical protein